jgi:hypothetical protein
MADSQPTYVVTATNADGSAYQDQLSSALGIRPAPPPTAPRTWRTARLPPSRRASPCTFARSDDLLDPGAGPIARQQTDRPRVSNHQGKEPTS